MKNNDKFLELLAKLDARGVIGLAYLLDVKVLTDKVDPETKKAIPRDAEDILRDCIISYGNSGRKFRRELLRAMDKYKPGGEE